MLINLVYFEQNHLVQSIQVDLDEGKSDQVLLLDGVWLHCKQEKWVIKKDM